MLRFPIILKRALTIPLGKVRVKQYASRKGSGGQKINTANSAVEIRFKLNDSFIKYAERDIIRSYLQDSNCGRLNNNGEIGGIFKNISFFYSWMLFPII